MVELDLISGICESKPRIFHCDRIGLEPNPSDFCCICDQEDWSKLFTWLTDFLANKLCFLVIVPLAPIVCGIFFISVCVFQFYAPLLFTDKNQ